jgi:hypothetical protein
MRGLAATMLLALLLPGCTTGRPAPRASSPAPAPASASATPGAPFAAGAPTAPEPPCRHPATKPAWPTGFPRDLPWPSGATVADVRTDRGVRTVRLAVPYSLRESVLFLLRRLPAAGYRLARGDAAATEADAPFSKGADLKGLARVFAGPGRCRTVWIVAVVRR